MTHSQSCHTKHPCPWDFPFDLFLPLKSALVIDSTLPIERVPPLISAFNYPGCALRERGNNHERRPFPPFDTPQAFCYSPKNAEPVATNLILSL